jgi:DNA replication protein DnaC
VAAGVGLLLTGPQGTGKTFLAALVLKELLQKGFSGTMLDSAKLVTAYMNTWDRVIGTRAKAKFDRDIRNVDILVVDDLARERQGGAHDQNSRSAAESGLEDVFRHRVQACLPTIVTTNRSGTTLGEVYGSHITTVLQECSIEVDFTGANGRPETKNRTLTETKAGVTRPIFYG